VNSINGKLVDSKQNKIISHTVIKSFEEKSDIEEDSKNTQSLWTYSQKSFPVNSKGIFSLEHPKILKNEDPVLGKLVKMTGRVIDTQGRQVSNRQVSLWGIPFLEEVDNGYQNPQLLLVTFSDKHGYFLGAYPKGKYSEAYGIVCNDKKEKMSYSLHKITFIRNIILIIITHIDYGKHFIICCTGLFPAMLTKSWNNYVA
jgi:hypothetical protein